MNNTVHFKIILGDDRYLFKIMHNNAKLCKIRIFSEKWGGWNGHEEGIEGVDLRGGG